MASSLTRQAWEYQQQLMDEMGEAEPLGDLPSDAVTAAASSAGKTGVDQAKNYLQKLDLGACVAPIAVATFAGFVAGKLGLIKTLLGVGVTYMLVEGWDRLAPAGGGK